MSNTTILPPGSPPPILSAASAHVHGGVTVDGVSLSLRYTADPLTHVFVGSAGGDIGLGSQYLHKSSWLGWASTAEPVTQADVTATALRLARELLASMNSESLCVAAVEEVRRRYAVARADREAAQRERDERAADYSDGMCVALAAILPLVCVLVDRIGPGFAAKANPAASVDPAATPS